MALPKLRAARPTDDIEALIRFYGDGLGLEILYRFEDHDGFDGVMLGHAGAPYHFEFTKAHGHAAGRAPSRRSTPIGIAQAVPLKIPMAIGL